MKILIITNGLTRSGGMRVLTNIANELIKIGDEVAVLCPERHSTPYYPIDAKIIKTNSSKNSNSLINKFTEVLSLFRLINQLAREYDVVLATHNSTAIPVWISTKFKSKGFYYIQAYEPEFNGKSFKEKIKKFIAKQSYKLNLVKIVNSPIYLKYKEIKANYIVAPGIDLQVFHSRKLDNFNRNSISIGCIGRNISWKGTKEIINAFLSVRDVIIKNNNVNITLNIAFEAPKSLINTHADYISLHQPHGDINLSEFYRKNDIFIATGLIQDGAFHYPCIEALASGCTVISNYAPATHDSAYLINKVDTNKISESILEAVQDILSGKKKIASHDMLTEFSWDSTAKKMRDIFEENINKSC